MVVISPGCHLCFWSTDCKLAVPTHPPHLGFSHLLEELTELRETLMFISLLYNKEYWKRQKWTVRWRHKVRSGKVPWNWGGPLSQLANVSTNSDTLWTPYFGATCGQELRSKGPPYSTCSCSWDVRVKIEASCSNSVWLFLSCWEEEEMLLQQCNSKPHKYQPKSYKEAFA